MKLAPVAPRAIGAVASATVHDDDALLDRLRAGDETAFDALVAPHDATLRRLAQTFVSSQAVAEDVVQETWLGVIRGLDRFEGRSSCVARRAARITPGRRASRTARPRARLARI